MIPQEYNHNGQTAGSSAGQTTEFLQQINYEKKTAWEPID